MKRKLVKVVLLTFYPDFPNLCFLSFFRPYSTFVVHLSILDSVNQVCGICRYKSLPYY